MAQASLDFSVKPVVVTVATNVTPPPRASKPPTDPADGVVTIAALPIGATVFVKAKVAKPAKPAKASLVEVAAAAAAATLNAVAARDAAIDAAIDAPTERAPTETDARIAKPIVKWLGGKSRLLDEIAARMPATFGAYHEPFAGGAALAFRIADTRPDVAIHLNDLNEDLYDMYTAVARDVDDVIARLRVHELANAAHGATYYYEQRARFNHLRAARADALALPEDRAAIGALMIYLNRACFNGLYRVNKKGDYNAPCGTYANLQVVREASLRAAARVIGRCRITCEDYQLALARVQPGDFVYIDSPYDASFTAYTSEGFAGGDQEILANRAAALVRAGARVMLSNKDTPSMRALYPAQRGFRIHAVQCSRPINTKGTGRGKVGEIIVTGGYA